MGPTVALILAAGRGIRAQGPTGGPPKQYQALGGKPVIRWSVEAFLGHPAINVVQLVTQPEDQEAYARALAGLALPPPVPGGATRQDSVRRGLAALRPRAPSRVLIHDGVRPFISAALIGRVAGALEAAAAVVPVLPVNDTLRTPKNDGYQIVARESLLRAQTPQGFRFAAIHDAHERFATETFTDDFALAERAGLTLATVAGEEGNLKLTTPDDRALAEQIAGGFLGDVRTGSGFDAHGFAAGDHVWLCGVKIAHTARLAGHSDADCGLHALTDALLGAIGAQDIGAHFPPSDARWANAPSHLFLSHAAERVRAQGGGITHVDVTLICEAPRIGPHREAMCARIAAILDIDPARVSVKATTTDGLGFIGRREGIAAQAVVTVRLPVRV